MKQPLKLIITVDAVPFSINSAYYKASHTRTRECRDWGNSIHKQLCSPENKALIQAFKASYKNEPLSVTLTFHHEIYKKYSGEISRRSMDLSNIEKLFIDLIFDERFNGIMVGNSPKFTVETLCIDDKQIVELISRKVQRTGDKSQIRIEITPSV